MTDQQSHSLFPGFKHIGSVDVDSGSIWVGDPCYVLKDRDEDRPKDLGENWHDVCRRFFDRSGYDAADEARREYRKNAFLEWQNSDEGRALLNAYAETFADKSEAGEQLRREAFEKMKAAEELHVQKKMAQAPDFSAMNTGTAQFNHDLGHAGMGIMTNTYYGDGSYPVYVERGDDGRVRRVLIDFDPYADEEE